MIDAAAIVTLDALAERLGRHGLRRDGAQGFKFDGEADVFRRRLVVESEGAAGDDGPVMAVMTGSAADVAAATAGRLAELGLSPLWLLPAHGWMPIRAGVGRQAWDAALARVNRRLDDLPAGETAVQLDAGRTPLAGLLAALLDGSGDADAWLLADAPLLVRTHAGRQVWLDSPAPRLLPALRL